MSARAERGPLATVDRKDAVTPSFVETTEGRQPANISKHSLRVTAHPDGMPPRSAAIHPKPEDLISSHENQNEAAYPR